MSFVSFSHTTYIFTQCDSNTGTNVDIATEMIENSGFRMLMAKDLDDAAQKAVRIADIVRQAEEIQVGVSFELPL